MRRIAEALVSLQQNGYVNYIGWSLTFACKDVKSESSDLSSVHKQMGKVLSSWNNNVKVARCKYYALNYYSAKQLLYLRYALYKLKYNLDQEDTATANDLSNTQLLSLLRSTSKDVTIDQAYKVMSLKDGEEISNVDAIPIIKVEDTSLNSGDGEATNSSVSKSADLNIPEDNIADKKLFIDNIMESYNYNRLLVETAAEIYEYEDDAVNWCEENEDNPEYNPTDQTSTIEEVKDNSSQTSPHTEDENNSFIEENLLHMEKINDNLVIDK